MSHQHDTGPVNRRQERRREDRRYLLLVLFTLVVIGGLLIALIFGVESLLTALPCLLAGAAMIFIPWFILSALQRWRDRSEEETRLRAQALLSREDDPKKEAG